jgi:hypothetical protein
VQLEMIKHNSRLHVSYGSDGSCVLNKFGSRSTPGLYYLIHHCHYSTLLLLDERPGIDLVLVSVFSVIKVQCYLFSSTTIYDEYERWFNFVSRNVYMVHS